MVILHKLIINNKYLRYTPAWWWWRYMTHQGYRFDDIQLGKSFWSSLNGGYEDMEYKWKFEQFWGKGAKPETIILSQTDYDSLVEKINAPSDPETIESLRKLLNRRAPWDA